MGGIRIQHAGGGGGGSGTLVATVPIGSAELLALDTVPKELVAAVPNQIIVPIVVVARPSATGDTYTGADTADLSVRWAGGAQLDRLSAASPLAHEPAEVWQLPLIGMAHAVEVADCVGLPLQLSSTDVLSGGTRTLTLTIVYYLAS